MKVVMTMVVRDEKDIIYENILFHQACGVDFFIVLDHNSKDGTTQVLKEFESKGILYYMYRDDNYIQQSKWVTMMAQMAKTKYNADWVINNDADEFWFPKDGDIKKAIGFVGKRLNLFAVKRHNFVLLSDNNGYFYERMIYRETDPKNPAGGILSPKVIHRGSKNVIVCEGNHELKNLSNPLLSRILIKLRLLKNNFIPIEIFHFPNRDKMQVYRKIYNQNKRFQNVPEIGDKLLNMSMEEVISDKGVNKYYQRISYDSNRIDREVAEGTLVKDDRLRMFFNYIKQNNNSQ